MRPQVSSLLLCCAPWASAVSVPSQSTLAAFDPEAWVGPDPAEIADHSWIEVSRVATNACARRSCPRRAYTNCLGLGIPYDEGFSKAYSVDCGNEYKDFGFPEHAYCNSTNDNYADKAVPVPYGCWFKVTAGSGSLVNVGKALRGRQRADVARTLGLPCGSADNKQSLTKCDKYKHPFDKLFCTKALERGYDSIIMSVGLSSMWEPTLKVKVPSPEIVVCTEACGSQPVSGGCAPVELRRPNGEACTCDDRYDYLNCGAGVPIMYNGTRARAPDPAMIGQAGGCYPPFVGEQRSAEAAPTIGLHDTAKAFPLHAT